MKRRLLLALTVLDLAIAVVLAQTAPAQASWRLGIDSMGCGGDTGSCIHLVNGTVMQPPINDPLYVHSLQGGLQGYSYLFTKCVHIWIGQKNPGPGNVLQVIHKSNEICFKGKVWGPRYTQNRRYADGTVFCSWSEISENQKGCVTVHD